MWTSPTSADAVYSAAFREVVVLDERRAVGDASAQLGRRSGESAA